MTFTELLYPPPDSVWTPAQQPPGQFGMDTLWQTNMTMEATQFSYIVGYVYKWSMFLCHVCVAVGKGLLRCFLVVFPTSCLASKCWKAAGQNNRLLFYLESTSIPIDITTKVNVCFPCKYMGQHSRKFAEDPNANRRLFLRITVSNHSLGWPWQRLL